MSKENQRQSTESQKNKIVNSTGNAIGIASIISSLFTYPLDVIKTRFQVHDGIRTNLPQYKTTLGAFQNIFRTEGIRGLYRGVFVATVGTTASWSIYMAVYSQSKIEMKKRGFSWNTSEIFISGVIAGIVTSVITNPLWVVKTRMQLQIQQRTTQRQPEHYRGLIDALRRIPQEEGIHALYKGLVPAILSSYHGAVQFVVYETLMKFFRNRTTQSYFTTGWESLVAGGLSKVVAMYTTHPLNVIKVRLQEQRSISGSPLRYKGLVDTICQIYRYEGIRGYYKGIVPAVWRLALNSAFFFYFFEEIKEFMYQTNLFISNATLH